MARYLIHVGPHKTGTTYLQLRFAAAREHLRRSGIVYPTRWCAADDQPSHRKLAIGLRERRIAELAAELEAIERDDPELVLISGEGLNLLEQSALELLRDLIRGQPATIVFYCRRWSELLPSLWQERVKHGWDETFPEFFASHCNDPQASLVMNFALRIDMYAKVFGRQNVRLVSYNNLGDSDVDLAEHFFGTFLPQQRTVIDLLPRVADARPNRSMQPLQVEIIRALNAFAAMDDLPPSSALRDWYIANTGRFDLTGLFYSIQANTARLTFSDASSPVKPLQDMMLALYGDLMVPPAHPGRLFEPRQSQIVFFQQRYLTDRVVRETLDAVYRAFRKGAAVSSPQTIGSDGARASSS